ncbi:MAG: hypothetical protein M2R45_02868 [Verrucomicrobia subdivision 3 bacterium]|nr:hypothetical protein [Limisphaerales bacterium]MCS1414720.1 hypothetical protein [Limisphaerales bacterium]
MLKFLLRGGRRNSFKGMVFCFVVSVGQAEPFSLPEGDIVSGIFFEQSVQPLLESACFDCHSHRAKSVKGGLYLDSRSGWEVGGHSGAVIVPGDPDASLLIRAVRYQDEDIQMPPKGKRLSEQQVSVLEKWVRLGAFDPRRAVVAVPEDSAQTHWAFQPVKQPAVPQVKNTSWVKTAVDVFILSALERRGLRPSKRADQRTLIRRVYFDLIGLPPTLDEIERFEADRSPDAFERLVDRLLASPQYGERWARHWLDIARYADTKGYVFQQERRFPYAYTYRDYVINTFNRDLPYDRFIVEQLAADQLGLTDNPDPLAGMGFLTLGRRFLGNQQDIIDDRIDVVTRGLMGLTVSCARCHDHKYDPIPTADYYSLYGVFASSEEPSEPLLLSYDPNSPLYLEYEAELKRLTAEWDDYRISNQKKALSKSRERTGEYLKVLFDARGRNRSETENMVRERKLSPVIAFRWQRYLKKLEGQFDPVFTPWTELTELSDAGVLDSSLVVKLTLGTDTEKPLNPLVAEALREVMPRDVEELAKMYGDFFQRAEQAWQERPEGMKALDDPAQEALRQVLYADGAPPNIALDQATQLLDVPTQQKIISLKREVDRLPATHPGAPACAMALVDRKQLVEPVVFLRGKPGARGPKVPRQFLSLVEGEQRQPFSQGSGRLELAQAIASAENPLTSRVIVNRVWRQHFGQPFVSTASDFGLRADPPSHPELLDYLAFRFMADSWSLKRLHKLILSSNTYQQASDLDEWHAAKDPENRYLWRMNRRRLELEPLRDTLLSVTGSLDTTMGGQPVEITKAPYTPRRTIYGFIERQNLPSIFRTFDLASPDSSSAGRFETTVPQQALFMVNSPFVQNLARNLEDEVQRTAPKRLDEQVRRLFESVLQRQPTRQERRLALDFLNSQTDSSGPVVLLDSWTYGYGAINERESSAVSFTPFGFFKEGSWRGGESLPDEKLGWALLSSKGGHPGATPNRLVIRRWTAPYAGVFEVEARLRHVAEEGNGVVAWVLASSAGLLGKWEVRGQSQLTNLDKITIAAGETLDFVVGSNGDVGHDSFEWPVNIRTASSPRLSDQRFWSSVDDFEGPKDSVRPLSPLARLGQVLLMSNELVFVD